MAGAWSTQPGNLRRRLRCRAAMPDPIPTDDLYARLGVPAHADSAAIDRAWRALLKQHHPDIAGAVSLELAKLINVAHDWLSDAGRRARYDAAVRQRGGRRTTGARGRPSRRPAAASPAPASARSAPPRPNRATRSAGPHAAPPDDPDETFGASAPAIRSFLAQAAALARDDLDRLSVTEAVDPVIDLRDAVPPELWARVEAIDARLLRSAPDVVLRAPAPATAARAYGHALVLEPFLWYYLADPEPLLEAMRRGWEAAVGLPRYGPNTDEVTAVLARLRRSSPDAARAAAVAWAELGDPEPWPADAWEFDFAALEVSTALARRDAAAAADPVAARAAGPPEPGELLRWRTAFASTAHVVTLRPIFPPRAYARFERALRLATGRERGRPSAAQPEPVVRRA